VKSKKRGLVTNLFLAGITACIKFRTENTFIHSFQKNQTQISDCFIDYQLSSFSKIAA
jgi:hypothetical protein